MENIFLILIRGLFYCQVLLQFILAFHRFKGTGCSNSFYHTVKTGVTKNSKLFVREIFDSKCEVADVDSIHVKYLDQITGPRLADWTARPSIFKKGD